MRFEDFVLRFCLSFKGLTVETVDVLDSTLLVLFLGIIPLLSKSEEMAALIVSKLVASPDVGSASFSLVLFGSFRDGIMGFHTDSPSLS